MEREKRWKDALLRLHVLGWDADDIDSACETLNEACAEGGAHEDQALRELDAAQVRGLLRSDLTAEEVSALRAVAVVCEQEGSEGAELREALYDLDAFAYRYAGHD